MKRPEHNLQCACVKWFRLRFRNYSGLFFSVPNGGTRITKEAISLKKEGVLPGVSDLVLMVPNKKYHGFFIEMKAGKNKQTKEQIEFEQNVRSVGYKYKVIRSFDEFEKEVTDYLKNR